MNFLRSFSFGAFALLASVPSGYASLYGNQLGADIDNADVHLDVSSYVYSLHRDYDVLLFLWSTNKEKCLL
jgi:hypothetical protein